MRKILAFIALGSVFATVEEFLTIVVLKRDLATYLFTLLILFPVFLLFVYFSSRLINRFTGKEPLRELIHFFLYGLIGLMIEWFIIGLSPWSDPSANPIVMFVFQLGMFSFWATVAFIPRLFLNPQELNQRIRKSILKFYIPYFIIVYIIGLAVPESLRFITIIFLIVFGYLFLNLFYLKYFLRAFSRESPAAT